MSSLTHNSLNWVSLCASALLACNVQGPTAQQRSCMLHYCVCITSCWGLYSLTTLNSLHTPCTKTPVMSELECCLFLQYTHIVVIHFTWTVACMVQRVWICALSIVWVMVSAIGYLCALTCWKLDGLGCVAYCVLCALLCHLISAAKRHLITSLFHNENHI